MGNEERSEMNKLKKWLVCLGVILLIPFGVSAKSYSSLNLEETLRRENIEHNLSNYKETNDQITIYMFRGEHCGHCQNFLKFLNDSVEEYGTYFKLVSYEVWQNENNAALASEVASHFGLKLSGVPFIVIGEKTYQGYTEKYNEEILSTIKNYYENKQTYKDVVEPLLGEKTNDTTGAAITIIVILAASSIIGFLIYMAKDESKIEEIKEVKKEEKIEITPKTKEEKEVKKVEETKQNSKKKPEKQNLPKLKEESITNKTIQKSKVVSSQKTKNVELPKKKETEVKKQTIGIKKVSASNSKPKKTTSQVAKKEASTVKKDTAKKSTKTTKKVSTSNTPKTKK